MRALVLAEAANPDWVSVPLVGWSMSQGLREVADVHLVTQIRNREAILARGLVEGQDVTFIDTEALAAPLYRMASVLRAGAGKGWTMVTAINALSYPYFEHMVWRRFADDIRRGRFDVVHRVTPVSPTAVSSIAAKCKAAGVPFILGPVNGGVPWPPGFNAERQAEREWLSYVRGVYRLLPGRRRMYDSAAAVLAGSRHTLGEMPASVRDKAFWLPENAIDPSRFGTAVVATPGVGPLRVCFVGRLVPYKGPDMLLEAAEPLLASRQMTLDILGDGPMRPALERHVARARLEDAVTFHGMCDHERVEGIMSRTVLMAFPSIREFGGGVVLEAMALGVVPLVVDYAGPGELVDDEVGLKVPIGSRDAIVASFRERLTALVHDPAPLAALSRAGRARVQERFTWSAKAQQVKQIYDWVQTPDEPKPALFPQTSPHLSTVR